jgi:hypothetical protein
MSDLLSVFGASPTIYRSLRRCSHDLKQTLLHKGNQRLHESSAAYTVPSTML